MKKYEWILLAILVSILFYIGMEYRKDIYIFYGTASIAGCLIAYAINKSING